LVELTLVMTNIVHWFVLVNFYTGIENAVVENPIAAIGTKRL
jgi:hypothetical protein